MPQDGHEERSGAAGPRAADAAGGARAARPVRAHQRRPHRGAEQPPLPLLLHLAAVARRALPHVKIRAVRATDQRDGDRQHMRARRPPAVLGGRMGAQHPVLPRPPSDRPGRAPQTRLVGTVRPQRVPVLHAAPRGAAAGRRRPPRLPHGGGPGRRLHGPHTHLPGASGEAEGAPRGLCGVLLSEGDRPLHDRRVRALRRAAHRESTGEVPMRPGGVLPEPVPQPAHALWEAATAAAFTPHRKLPGHRATLLRPASREDPNRNPHKRHAALRKFVLLAVHGHHVTYDVAAAGGNLILAVRLPVPRAEARPEVPGGSRGRGDFVQRVPRGDCSC